MYTGLTKHIFAVKFCRPCRTSRATCSSNLLKQIQVQMVSLYINSTNQVTASCLGQLKSFLQKRACLNLKRQKVISGVVEKLLVCISCCKWKKPINLLLLLNSFHMTLSNGKKKSNKKTATEGRGCFYRHKHQMMNKSYIREKSSMHLQHCTQKSRTRSNC